MCGSARPKICFSCGNKQTTKWIRNTLSNVIHASKPDTPHKPLVRKNRDCVLLTKCRILMLNIKHRLLVHVLIILANFIFFYLLSFQFIFKDEGFNKPFFTTYVKSSSFMIYLTGFLFYEPWRLLCLQSMNLTSSKVSGKKLRDIQRCQPKQIKIRKIANFYLFFIVLYMGKSQVNYLGKLAQMDFTFIFYVWHINLEGFFNKLSDIQQYKEILYYLQWVAFKPQ